MSKIYVGQTLAIRVNTGIDLTSANICQIKYKTTTSSGVLTASIYNIKRGIIDVVFIFTGSLAIGVDWEAWAYITFLDGSIGIGEVFRFHVWNEGE